jgi:hypothetical protein
MHMSVYAKLACPALKRRALLARLVSDNHPVEVWKMPDERGQGFERILMPFRRVQPADGKSQRSILRYPGRHAYLATMARILYLNARDLLKVNHDVHADYFLSGHAHARQLIGVAGEKAIHALMETSVLLRQPSYIGIFKLRKVWP